MIHLKLLPSRLPHLQAALTYFGICFVIGCLLGPVRELLLACYGLSGEQRPQRPLSIFGLVGRARR